MTRDKTRSANDFRVTVAADYSSLNASDKRARKNTEIVTASYGRSCAREAAIELVTGVNCGELYLFARFDGKHPFALVDPLK